ncbi:MAG TPA: radical SAM protein, partial [bacterium]|nr:radical SAM protein [bacterium]
GMTQQATRAYEIADRFRKAGVPVVMGGIHATVLPDEAALHADAVLAGEAERVWRRLVSDFRRGKMKPLYRGEPADLSKSPVPRYDLVKNFNFENAAQRFVPVQASRGCPHNCAFCSVTHVYGRRFRTKTVPQVAREFEAIISEFGPDTIVKFNDDNPFVNKAFARRMLEAIAPLGVRWFALADIEIAEDPKLLDLMRRAGCIALGIGFESMEPGSLGEVSLWKKDRIKNYPGAIEKIRKEGIAVAGSFMFGFDHDTSDSFRRVRDFVLEHRVPSKYSIVTPFPGTRLYDELLRQGRIHIGLDWSHYNFLNVVFETKIPPQELCGEMARLYEDTWPHFR